MYSFGFPSMLGSTTSNLIKDKDAIRSNLILLLSSEQTSLFGDPYLGSRLRQILFEQATSLAADLLIDEVYEYFLETVKVEAPAEEVVEETTEGETEAVEETAEVETTDVETETAEEAEVEETETEEEKENTEKAE